MTSWSETVARYLAEGRTVSGGKGDQTAKSMEKMQLSFNQQLMGVFQKQFANQQSIFTFLKNKLQPMIENPAGYSREALAAMRTTATDNLSNAYQNAQRTLQSKQFAAGGRELPNGANDQLNAALLNAEASDKGAAQNTITLANENLKQQNYWAAMNALNGQAAQLNPLGYAGAFNQGSSAGADLSRAYSTSQETGFWNSLGNSFADSLGKAGGSALMGGGGGGCWLAAAHFGGWNDPRTHLVRQWLWTKFAARWYGRPIMALYLRFGERLSRSRLAVKAFGPLFDAALVEACNG